MRTTLVTLCFVALAGCAHADRKSVLAANAFDVMSDDEIARMAVAEALGELHTVSRVDEDGTVIEGKAAFRNRDERLAYERRVDGLIREKVYAQGPTMELLRKHCEQLQQTGWSRWPGDAAKIQRACEYGDLAVTVHSVFKKPMLQRALLDVLVPVAKDPMLEEHVAFRLEQLNRSGVERFVIAIEKWERVEGFRPRG